MINQRGTARKAVFRTRADHPVYLDLLREQGTYTEVSLLAYCLMPNHIHLIAVPPEEDSPAVVLRPVHGRFFQYFNARRHHSGHLWQNRFYSCPMAQSHLWTALHYVEANPERAAMVQQMVQQPIDYEWSSAEAHLSGHDRRRLLDREFFRRTGGVNNSRLLFGHPLSDSDCRAVRIATHAGQPLGDEEIRHNLQLERERRKAPASAPVAATLANEQVLAVG